MAGRPPKARGRKWDDMEDQMAKIDVLLTLWEERIAPKLDPETRELVVREGGWYFQDELARLVERKRASREADYRHLEEESA